jgi:O-antigen/teichoic acid export membrane protein
VSSGDNSSESGSRAIRPLTDSLSETVPEAVHLGEEGQGDRAPAPSLVRNSAARFVADGAGLASSLVASIVTARVLGPTGKGLFSSLTFLSAMVIHLFSAGLGDAAIVLVGQRRATLQRALSSTLGAGLCSAVLGMGALWLACLVAFRGDWERMRAAALISCLGLPLFLCAYHLSYLLSAQERIPASSMVLATMNLSTTAAIALFVAGMGLSVPGGALAGVVGAACGLTLAAALLRRSGLSLTPGWDRSYVGAALRYGPAVAASYLVSIMLQRADLVLVYALAGSGPAGHYSVGLTIASLAALLPIAISNATFPRIAKLGKEEAPELMVRTCRLGVAAAAVGAVLLTVATPVLVPLLFGREFLPAVGPTLILVPSGLIWSAQWLLCRAWAARGRPGLLMASFGVSLLVMVGLDILVVPRFGITGAAAVSVIAPALGLALCLVTYRRSPGWPLPILDFLPRPSDFRAVGAEALRLLPVRKASGAAVDGRP